MRTEGLRHALVPALLIFALVFFTAFIPTPVLAGMVISYPGHPSQPQLIFDVPQGQTFLLRHRLAWDDEANPGYYLVAIWWDYYDLDNNARGDNGRHFTLDSVVGYFDNNGDNIPDAGVAMIDNTMSAQDNGTRFSMAVTNAVGDLRLGTFNVDITLRASGPDGTPHSPTDNHPIYYTILQSLEAFPPAVAVPGPVTVRVPIVRRVDVTVEPKHHRGTPGDNLTFLVKVHNTGNIADNYLLSVEPDGWPMENIIIENNQLENVKPDETKTTSLSVHIPENAKPCTHKEIVVVAKSEFHDATDNDNALIQVVSAYLHAEEEIELEDPVSTQWHELHPNFSKRYHLTSWEDTNGDGKLSPSDQIEMENETGELDNYHVKDVTVTIFISKKPENIENMYLEFEDGFKKMENAITQPEGTQWHEIWPVFSRRFRLEIWKDENDDGVLGPSDQIFMMNKDNGEIAEYHVDEVATDLVLCKKPAVAPSAPILKSPADGTITNDNTPTFVWILGLNADTHRLLVDNDSDFTSPIENRPFGPTDNSYTPVPENSLPDDNYSWKVIARNAVGENHSNIWTFIIDTTPPAKPTLVRPFNGENINDNTPNLDWNPVSDISLPVTYDVWVDNDLDFSSPIAIATRITDDNYQVTTELAEGVWHWRVCPIDNAGNVGENSQRSFRVDITAPTPPTLLEPGNGTETSNNKPTFRWTAITIENSLPITYDLQVDNDNNFLSPEINVPRLTDNKYTPTTALADENYSWRVRAVDNAGNAGGWSSIWTFLIKTVVRRVEVSISPGSKSGPPGETLTYVVTVTNKGDVQDTYDLTADDEAIPSWNPAVSPTFLTIAAGGSGTATLSVTIPSGASVGDEDIIEVYARSRIDPTVVDGDRAYAKATALRRVKVSISISPENQRGSPKDELEYIVTVKNTGTIKDNYSLKVSDNENWNPKLSDNLLTNIGPGENGVVTLTVTVPEDAENGSKDKVTVTATSKENVQVSAENSCTATAIVVRSVEVSISPENKSGPPENTLTYEVTVKNKGNIADNYTLAASDDKGWILVLLKSSLEVPPGENRTTTLRVTIPRNAAHSTRDNVTVTATSQSDNKVKDNASCIAHAIVIRRVEVSISPAHKTDEPGEQLSYTVTVTNRGNVADTYDLTTSDSAVTSWNPTVSPTFLAIAAGGSGTATLSVTIPSGAGHGERDNLRIVATSRENAGVSASASCEAEVSIRTRIEVSISPGSGSGEPGTTLIYTVTVRNAGLIDDNYTLRAVGATGWSVSIEPESLTLAAGASDNATLTVVVPPDASVGDSMTTQVSVRSGEDPTYYRSDTCRTIVTGAPPKPGIELPIPLAISVVLIGAAIIVPAYLVHGRRKKAGRRSVLRDVGFRPLR